MAQSENRGRLAVRVLFFITGLGMLISRCPAQTTNYSIAAGSGTLTYSQVVSVTGSCPVGSPTGPQQNVTQYLYDNFAFNGQSLSGSVTYISVPTASSYCPTTGWKGTIPTVLTGSNYYVFFTPSLTGAGTASLDALTVSASPNPGTYGSSVQFTATNQFPNASGTVTFSDGSTTLGTSTMSGSVATFSTSSLALGAHSVSASYSGNDPSVTSPTLSFTVNQAPQSITFNSISPVTYGVSPITLTATGGASGNPVTFSIVSGPGTVSGSTLTVTGAGTIVVAANQAGSTNYSAAPQVTQSVTVNKATLTVTANNASRAYGASNPTFTPSYSGFKNGDTSSVLSGAPNLTTTAITSSNVGTYTITAAAGTLSASNYSFAYVNGTLTITQASQAITFSAPTSPVTYGVSPITLSASANSGLGVTFSIVSGPGAVSGSSLRITGAGTVVVAANQAGNGNYLAATQVTQSVTVNKATLTVTANPATRVYGVANPSFAASYSGFVNGDTQSVVSGAPSFTTTATTTSTVGTYAITPAAGSLAATNYSFTFANGTLTITIATPTITWPTPATAPNGTILSTVQLNASANTAGTYSYTPLPGTTVTPGIQQLNVTFTPSDTTDYTPATKSVSLTVALTPATGIIATVAGNGTEGYTADSGPALNAEFFLPAAVATDAQGNLYIADQYNNVIRKITASTDTITTYAGNGTAGPAGGTQAATSAELNEPTGVAVDSQGNLYIADSLNGAVRKVTPAGTISTFVGSATGATISAGLTRPNGVAVDASGNLYIADTGNYCVRKVSTSGTISTIAGECGTYGTSASFGDNGPATAATFFAPVAVAVDSNGNLYIADQNYAVVRKVNSSGTITTFAGTGTCGYSGDGGSATSAMLCTPSGLATDAGGNVYIADTNNHLVRKVSTAGIISDAGTPDFNGYNGDFGPAIEAELNGPLGVAVDASGNLYIADTINNVVRAVGAGPITPLISWPLPAAITYGTQLAEGTGSGNQLNATSGVAGNFSYSPHSGARLSAGQQTLTAIFTPTDTVDYIPVSVSVPLMVEQAIPAITWATPAAIVADTALTASPASGAQLDATSPVAGTWAYIPIAGTKLPAGAYLLSVTFTPTDTTDYATVTASVPLTVQNGTHTQDSGTVTLSVNTGSGYTVASSTNYSAGATPSSIAAGLATGVVSGSPVSISAVNDQVTIASKANGTTTTNVNYPFQIQTSTWDSTVFSQPSFAYPTISGTLDGGAAASSSQTQQTIYSFCVLGPDNPNPNPNCTSSNSGYDAAGNLVNYIDSVTGTWSDSYDTLNRLSTASQTAIGSQALSSLPNLCWNYDAFGNREEQYAASKTFQSGSGGPNTCQPQSGATIATAWASFNTNNQMISTNARGISANVTYDAAGNVTWDGANYYLYDAEGRICAVASTAAGYTTMTGYMYDAEGTRVSKGTIQQWSCNPTTAQYATQTDYILGPGGEQMSEYAIQPNNTMAWVHTNVWAAGRLLATYAQDSSSTTQMALLHFYFDDPLGTRRTQTDYAGNLEQLCGSLPYGDGETCAPTPTEHLFTNKERDAESGNDYFGARYYASTMGIFLTPDWSTKLEPVPYAKLDNPQSLNLYAYVGNNPLARTDPTGHYLCNGNQCKQVADALNTVKQAIASGKLNKDQAGALQKIVDFYGVAGKDNKVTVNTKGDATGLVGANTGTDKSGRTTITVNLSGWDNKDAHSFSNGGNAQTEKGATIAHEGEHGIQQKAEGMPTSNEQEYKGEQQAFQVQSYVNQGLGDRSAYDVWSPSGGYNQNADNIWAQNATQRWCGCSWTPQSGGPQ